MTTNKAEFPAFIPPILCEIDGELLNRLQRDPNLAGRMLEGLATGTVFLSPDQEKYLRQLDSQVNPQ